MTDFGALSKLTFPPSTLKSQPWLEKRPRPRFSSQPSRSRYVFVGREPASVTSATLTPARLTVSLQLLMRFLHAGRYFELMAVLNDRVSICVVAEVPRLEAAGSREKGREKVEAMASVSPVTLKHSTGPNVTPGTSADRIVLDLSGSGASTTRKVAGVSIKEAASLVSEAAKSKAVMDVAGHNARGLKPVVSVTFWFFSLSVLLGAGNLMQTCMRVRAALGDFPPPTAAVDRYRDGGRAGEKKGGVGG